MRCFDDREASPLGISMVLGLNLFLQPNKLMQVVSGDLEFAETFRLLSLWFDSLKHCVSCWSGPERGNTLMVVSGLVVLVKSHKTVVAKAVITAFADTIDLTAEENPVNTT